VPNRGPGLSVLFGVSVADGQGLSGLIGLSALSARPSGLIGLSAPSLLLGGTDRTDSLCLSVLFALFVAVCSRSSGQWLFGWDYQGLIGLSALSVRPSGLIGPSAPSVLLGGTDRTDSLCLSVLSVLCALFVTAAAPSEGLPVLVVAVRPCHDRQHRQPTCPHPVSQTLSVTPDTQCQ
jgi:hypothetical protein